MLLSLDRVVQTTKLGRSIRAVAQDAETASLMGVNIDRTIAMTFVVGGALGGAAGFLFAMGTGVVYTMGFMPALKAFTAAVLGGIGNLRGAMLGGLLLGIVESLVGRLRPGGLHRRRRVRDPGARPACSGRPGSSASAWGGRRDAGPSIARPAVKRLLITPGRVTAVVEVMTGPPGSSLDAGPGSTAPSSSPSPSSGCSTLSGGWTGCSSALIAFGLMTLWTHPARRGAQAARARRSGRRAARSRESRCAAGLMVRCWCLRSCCRTSRPTPFWQAAMVEQIAIYVLLAIGLNVVVGFAGLLDLGYVAFYAIGAYTTAWVTGALPTPPPFHIHFDPFWAIPVAIGFAMLSGVLLGPADPAAARRLPGHRDARLRRDHHDLRQQPLRDHRRVARARARSRTPCLHLGLRSTTRGDSRRCPTTT